MQRGYYSTDSGAAFAVSGSRDVTNRALLIFKQRLSLIRVSFAQGYLHDTASPYAHRVHFTIYTIKDTSRQLGPWRQRGGPQHRAPDNANTCFRVSAVQQACSIT